MHTILRRLALLSCSLLVAVGTAQAETAYLQTNLVTNDQSVAPAQQTDPNLINPWGVSFSTTSPIWVSNQGGTGPLGAGSTSLFTLHGNTSSPTVATFGVPNLGGAAPSDNNGPTGQVSTAAPGITTSSTDFNFTAGGSTGKAAFIFANLDGSISAWKGGLSAAVIQPSATVAGASFTGLAIGNTSTGAAQIYAADQNSTNVYIFNSQWQKIGTLAADSTLPAGFKAFNVQNIGGKLFVTYANPNSPAGGVVDEYSTNGALLGRVITDSAGAHLNTPWGLAVAPVGWGQFGGDLLIGNNDVDGFINAYSLSGTTATWQGTLMLNTGQPFHEGELWGMTFGNGGSGGSPNTLYIAAGLEGATNGLIAAISVPEPSSGVLGLIAVAIVGGGWQWKHRRRPRVA
ncbi:MAG TPA: TIGR03118 family protein [Isosphaeraceae bacterium]|nr:TIGR03118 family protein [Isosphaeraceae bacterium]